MGRCRPSILIDSSKKRFGGGIGWRWSTVSRGEAAGGIGSQCLRSRALALCGYTGACVAGTGWGVGQPLDGKVRGPGWDPAAFSKSHKHSCTNFYMRAFKKIQKGMGLVHRELTMRRESGCSLRSTGKEREGATEHVVSKNAFLMGGRDHES